MPDPVQQIVDEAADTPHPGVYAVEETLHQLANGPVVPNWARSRNVKDQFIHAFELIGGIPRLALWAHQNPTEFFKLYSKLLPASVNASMDGKIKIELSWLQGRDTSGRSSPRVIDVEPSR